MQGQKGRCGSSARKEKSVSTLLMGPPVCCVSGCILALEELSMLGANAVLELSVVVSKCTEGNGKLTSGWNPDLLGPCNNYPERRWVLWRTVNKEMQVAVDWTNSLRWREGVISDPASGTRKRFVCQAQKSNTELGNASTYLIQSENNSKIQMGNIISSFLSLLDGFSGIRDAWLPNASFHYVENTSNSSSAQRQGDLTDKTSEGMKCDCSHNGWDFRDYCPLRRGQERHTWSKALRLL